MTVGAADIGGSGRSVGQLAADQKQLPGGAAEGEFGLLGGDEVAMHRMVAVDADAAVHVDGGVGDAVPGFGRPERRGGHLDVGGQVLGEPPGRLGQRQAQALDIDVVVGQRWATAWKLPIGRSNCSRVRAYSAVSSSARSSTPSWNARAAQRLERAQPVQHLGATDDAVGADLDAGQFELAGAAHARWSAAVSP